MSALTGRARWLYTPRPSYDTVSAVFFGAATVLFVVITVTVPAPELAVFAVVSATVAALQSKRVMWTRRHPQLKVAVRAHADAVVRVHPARTMVISVLGGAAVGPALVWRVTTHGHAPGWAWPLAVVGGLAVGYTSGRRRLQRASRSEF